MVKSPKFFIPLFAALLSLSPSPASAAGGPFGGYYGELSPVDDAVSFYVVNREVIDFGADVRMQCNDPELEDEPDFERIFSVRGEDLDGRILPTIRINRETGKARATFTFRDSGLRLGTVTVRFNLKKRGRSRVRFEVSTGPEEGSTETCSALVNFVDVARNPNSLPTS